MDIPYKPPYNEAQQSRDIPIKCLCLCAFWAPKQSQPWPETPRLDTKALSGAPGMMDKVGNIGALIIRTWVWGILYYTYNTKPSK